MKNLYKFAAICLSLGISQAIIAQSINTKHNHLTAATSPDGILFQQTSTGTSGLQHNSENAGLIYTAGLWLSGIKNNGQLSTSTTTFRSDFAPGIKDWDKDATLTMATISSDEIQYHRENYNSPSYQMADNIKNWPVAFNTQNGSTVYTAPFRDVNNNEVYDPENGDYPDIIGNTFTIIVMHDQNEGRNSSNGDPLDVVVTANVFSWDIDEDEAISNTVFVNYTIHNTGISIYDKMNKGMFIDFDLGNSNDDYIGSDSANHFVYAYNGDNDDDVTGGPSIGFGENPPVIGAKLICGQMTSTMYYNIGGGPQGDPNQPTHYHNYLESTWKDGASLRAAGDGYQSQGHPTSYALSGDPVSGIGWTEASAGNPPNDRRMILGTTEEMEFKPGDVQSFTLAFSYARDNNKDHVENITTLRNTFGSIGRFLDSEKHSFSNYWSDNFSCQLVGVEENISNSVTIHPNPTTDVLNIENADNFSTYKIASIDGKVLMEGKTTETLDVRKLKTGIYHLQLLNMNGGYSSIKFLKN